jgi:hypothetical protein
MNKALNTKESTKEILVNITKNLNTEEISHTLKLKSLGNIVSKKRSEVIKNFICENSDIPSFLTKNKRNENFIEYDSGVSCNGRFIIFMSEFNKMHLRKSSIWLIDGTFYCVPTGFSQLLSIHAILYGKSFPLAYILCTDKTELMYDNIFEKIISTVEHKPDYIVIDFEMGLLNSLTRKFPLTRLKGCVFHFGQSIWRKLQELGLGFEYKNNKNFKSIVKMYLHLTFVPEEKIMFEFEKISQYIEVDVNLKEKFNEFLKYFKRMYISYDRKIGTNSSPFYSHSFWSVHDNIKLCIPRSTCCVEAWHRSINSQCSVAHPNLAKFVEIIQKEEETTRFKLIQETAGNFSLSFKDFAKEEKLRLVVCSYEHYENFAFFAAVSKVYDWLFE